MATSVRQTNIFTLFYYACYDNLLGVNPANAVGFNERSDLAFLMITHGYFDLFEFYVL